MSNIDLTFESASGVNASTLVGKAVYVTSGSQNGTRGVIAVCASSVVRPIGVVTYGEDALGGLCTVRVAGIAPTLAGMGGIAVGALVKVLAGQLDNEAGLNDYALGVLLPETGAGVDGGKTVDVLLRIHKVA